MFTNLWVSFHQLIVQVFRKKWLFQFAISLLITLIISTVKFPEFIQFNLKTWKPFQNLPVVAQASPTAQQMMQQGREFFQSEQFSQAATLWQQAVTKYRAESDKLNEALALNYLSLAYQKLGQWLPATDAIELSLSILKTKVDTNKDRLLIFAQALNTQGHLQLALGKNEPALKTWEQAAKTYSQIEDLEGAIGCQINQAQAMQTLGLYRRARKTLEQIEISLKSQPNSLIKAIGFRSLANALRVSGDLEKSRDLLQQSLEIAQELNIPSAISSAQFSLANTARTLAKRAEELKDKKTAEAELLVAIDAYQQAAIISSSPQLQLQSKLNQLSLLADTQQFNEAQKLLPIIQLLLKELPVSRRSVYARINLAHSLMKFSPLSNAKATTITNINQSLITEIAQLLATAVQEAKNLQDQPAESYALGSLGELYEQTQQISEAQTLTQQALSLAQAMNASDIAYRWQWQLGRLLKAKSEKKEAIKVYSIAVKTLQSLRSDLVAINPDNPDVQFSFRESVEPVYRELVELLLTTEEQPSPEDLQQARQVIESLQLAELDNFFQEACLDAKPVQIDQIDNRAAVFYPIILKDRVAVILALPQSSLKLFTLIKPQDEINHDLNQIRQDISRGAGNNQQVLQFSQQVYNWLIKPAEADLQANQVQTLVFVLDGLLRNIPMAALHDGQQYLIEKYSIAITPGLQLLPPQPVEKEKFQLLTAGISEARSGFSELPNVEQELKQIQSQLSSHLLFNQDFTNENLQKEINLSPFPIVHIATHGQFSSQATETFILTWDGKINVKELDTLLRKKEENLSPPIELLVFSACETAAGDERAALGLAGVAVRAGARSTLATLWKVSDQSTATLMVRFYQELAKENSITKAEALRRAQISFLKDPLYPLYKLPYYWASYILVGNWR
jgi:CHAT domain-containing protein